jgi:hypothetical protein
MDTKVFRRQKIILNPYMYGCKDHTAKPSGLYMRKDRYLEDKKSLESLYKDQTEKLSGLYMMIDRYLVVTKASWTRNTVQASKFGNICLYITGDMYFLNKIASGAS